MVGNANSGGKPQSIEDRIKKVNAGSMRHGGPMVSLTGKTLPRDKLATIQDYDDVIGQPLNWGDVKKREEVIAILEDANRRRGNLIPRAEAKAAAMEVYAAFTRLGGQLSITAVQGLEGVSTEDKLAMRNAIAAAWEGVMNQIGKIDALKDSDG